MVRSRYGSSVAWLVLVALILTACGSAASSEGAGGLAKAGNGTPVVLPTLAKNGDGYVDVSIEQLAATLPAKDYTLVNVHIPYEGELPKTDLFVPYNKIEQHLGALPGKDAPILLYCRSGRMSTEAAEVLVRAGYTNVMELDGGTVAWESAGHELLYKR